MTIKSPMTKSNPRLRPLDARPHDVAGHTHRTDPADPTDPMMIAAASRLGIAAVLLSGVGLALLALSALGL